MITARSFWIWFGGMWLAGGLVFVIASVVAGVYQADLDASFAAEGRQVEGIVLTKQISTSRDRGTKYRVTFSFSTAQGETIRGSADVDSALWDALAERGPIALTYLPDRPSRYRVAGESGVKAILVLAFGLSGAVFAIGGGVVVFLALRRRRRELALEQHGVHADATVTDVVVGHLRINGIPQWTVRYRFQDREGRSHDGSRSVPPEEAQDLKRGARGRVRYDAGNPRSHVWLGGAR